MPVWKQYRSASLAAIVWGYCVPWFLLSAAWAGSPADSGSAMSEEAIEQAIRDLGHDAFAVRRRATYDLWQAGDSVEPALREALQSPDPEVVARARWILDRLQFGLHPETPPQLVHLVQQFRSGTEPIRRSVLKRLVESERIDLAVRLIHSMADPKARERLMGQMINELTKSARQRILAGNFDAARQLLEMAARTDSGCRDFAAYLLLQGKLEEETSRRAEALAQHTDEAEARLLGYLLRAQGDLPAALRVFDQQAVSPDLARGVLVELGDWNELARRIDETLPAAGEPLDENITDRDAVLEGLAASAAFHHLAGNEAQSDAACKRLDEAATDNPDEAPYVAKAMLIAGRLDEGIRRFSELDDRRAAFDLLVAQMRFDDAFQVAGMDGPRSHFYLDIPVQESADESNEGSARQRAVFALGLSVGQTLQRLGWKVEARRLFNHLASAAHDNAKLEMHQLCRAEREAGLDAEAFQCAAEAMDARSAPAYLNALFSKQAVEAIRWWSYFVDSQPESEPSDRLARVRGIVERSADAKALLALADEVEGALAALPPDEQRQWLLVLGQLRLDAADAEGARRCLERAAEADRSPAAYSRLADFHWKRREWTAAAEAYRSAIDLAANVSPESIAHLLFLEGYARSMIGDAAEGNRLMTVARLLPLGNTHMRHSMAGALAEHGLANEAAGQWRIILRTGQFNEWALNDAGKQVGNTLSGTDDLQAAIYWQRLLLSCLKRNANLADASGYLKLIQLIHRLRARGLLAEGKSDQAVREARLAHAGTPGDTALVCDLVPRLDEAGRKDDADRLFQLAFDHRMIAAKEHPSDASLLNNTAWMAATCNRELEHAQDFAQRATELSPDNPVYLDTLAEVHFRRGDRKAAAALARRCTELDPSAQHYRDQLARFTESE